MQTKLYYFPKEAAELTGLSKSTLRFYEEIGVLDKVARNKNGYRTYTQSEIDWLLIVAQLRAFDLPLKTFIGRQHSSDQLMIDYLKSYRQEIENKLSELEDTRNYVASKIAYLEERIVKKDKDS